MQCFSEGFDPEDYDGIADIRGNASVTLMSHNQTEKLIVRKTISGINKELYKQLVHIRHENLVQILGLDETESNCYTYEEYIEGKTLKEILADEPVSEEEAANWIGQLCEAVRMLHEQSPIIIHRDIKPGNIMLTTDGVIKLIDFDAAKEFISGRPRDTELIGTPDYAAPEQYGFATSDPRTDIYAIGVLFHELLTGYKPNEGRSPYKGRYKYIIQNCIELDPQRRYRSIKELERQLGLRGIRMLIGVIPGFRTGVWWKKLIATISYIVAAVCAVSTLYEDPTLLLLGCLITTFVPPYLQITNPLRFRERLPLIKSRSVPIKIAGVVLYLLIWLLLFAIVVVNYAERK